MRDVDHMSGAGRVVVHSARARLFDRHRVEQIVGMVGWLDFNGEERGGPATDTECIPRVRNRLVDNFFLSCVWNECIAERRLKE